MLDKEQLLACIKAMPCPHVKKTCIDNGGNGNCFDCKSVKTCSVALGVLDFQCHKYNCTNCKLV